ncbi:AzlC family ABC transporter permease [Intrasporangium sp.]|uniref:AzlC family ABC transporter permease n=1 Tax=Intrasporangium sp. TaxID=1925024 RepID=UPI00293ACF33|nr:AzlC family ABC transporter permease [Intrasporangium sp.]MDV3222212.1 AzlC family ABC transporter permease [Intrasporangium sp.]
MSHLSARREGCRDGLSIVIGYIPFALALGAALGSAGVDPWIAWLSSPVVIAGAAQLVTVEMLGAGASAVLALTTALVVNARHLLYSATLATLVGHWRRRDRWVAAYLLADPMFALAAARLHAGDPPSAQAAHRAYFFAASWTCWAGWLALTGAGVLIGDLLPTSLPMDVAAPLTFLLLVLPTVTSPPTRTAASVGGLVAVLASGLPLGLGLLAGVAAGVAAGAATPAGGGARNSSAAPPTVTDLGTGEPGEPGTSAPGGERTHG